MTQSMECLLLAEDVVDRPPTCNGFGFRPKLSAHATGRDTQAYDQTPDIIGSQTLVPDPSSIFSTASSWATSYGCRPIPGFETYYYVRCLNGARTVKSAAASLACMPAQLLLFPSMWRRHRLTTANGDTTVPLQASPGRIAVGEDPFVMSAPPPTGESTFYSFVAEAVAADRQAPTDDGVLLGSLLNRSASVGVRTSVFVNASSPCWSHRLGLAIPNDVDIGGQLLLTIRADGFSGCRIELDVAAAAPALSTLRLGSTILGAPLADVPFTLEPGVATTMTVRVWNDGQTVAPGATITLLVSYVLPKSRLADALDRGGLDPRFGSRLIQAEPKLGLPVGSATFIARTLST